MTSLFRRASKLVKGATGSESKDGDISSGDVTNVASKGLFSRMTVKKTSVDGSASQTPILTRKDTVTKEKERDREKEKEMEATLANATSALTAARKVRSEHNLAEEQNTSGEKSGESKADEPKPGFLKKASLHRSNTAGKMTHVFNSLEAKDVPVPVKPKTLSVTKDALAFTGRTSVTNLNKNNPSNISINQTGNGSVFALNNEDAPPMPLPFLNTPTSHPTIEPTLPKIGTLKAPRSATEQPMSLAKSTNQLFAGTGPSSQLGGSSIDIKYKNALQQGSPSQNQLLMAGNTGGHRDTSGNGFLSTTAAAAVARQEKRNAGLSAYEISTPSSAPSLKRYCLDDFHIVRRVGRGGFAIVFLVRMKQSTGRYFALKAIRKAEVVKLKQEKQIVNEKEILKSVKHNFIVELFHTFQDTHYLYMVMEYIDGGDLFSYLRKVQKFGDEDSKFYAAEVLMSLQYLHGENVIFRDLKPENILLDMTGHVKLADFGFAKVVTGTTKSFCGTPDYIAREIVLNRPYTKMVDWWSFGVLIFELVSGKTPFQSESPDGIYDNIEHCKIAWNPLIKGNCKDIIARLLDKDPEKRLGSNGDGAEIRAHAWFKTVKWAKAEVRQMQPPFLPACEAPDVIEREREKRGQQEDYAGMLKSGAGGGASATDKRPDLSWLTNGAPDPFKGF